MNINLAVVVSVSFGVQLLSHHNTVPVRFLKTSFMSVGDGLMLVAVSAIPLLVLEIVKSKSNQHLSRLTIVP